MTDEFVEPIPGSDGYQLMNWTPIWIDQGKTLRDLLVDMKDDDNIDRWTIVAYLLHYHLTQDLWNLKEVNDAIRGLGVPDEKTSND